MPRPSSAAKRIEWEKRICQQRESGLSIGKWCHKNELSPHVFSYWKDRLYPKSQPVLSSFVELPIVDKTGIAIEYRGVRILIDRSFDEATLRSCLAVLRDIQC